MAKGLRRFFFVSVGGVAVLGGGAGLVYYRRLKENRSITAEAYNAKQLKPDLTVAFKALKDGKDPVPLLLYRYTTCPFCGKVKAFLDHHAIKHDCVEVEPMFKSQIKTSEYKKVPQLQFLTSGHHGPYLVDSDIIVDTLAPLVGKGEQVDDPEIKKWRDWARSSLVRHLVVNINKSLIEAWQGYDYIDQFDTIPKFNKVFLKVMGAPVMYLVSRYKTVPALKAAGELKDDSNVQEVLRDQVRKFVNEALPKPKAVDDAKVDKKAKGKPAPAASTPFHGGEKPDLADLDVYGVLQSVRGHKVYDDLVKTTGIAPWLSAMDKATFKADPLIVPS